MVSRFSKRKLVICVLVLINAGCALQLPQTPDEYRLSKPVISEYCSDKAADEVVATLEKIAGQCFKLGVEKSFMHLGMYPLRWKETLRVTRGDNGAVEIGVWYDGPNTDGGYKYLMDVVSSDACNTKITVYHPPLLKEKTDAIINILNGGDSSCS